MESNQKKIIVSGKAVNKKFGSLQVLHNVDIDVHENELVSIVGSSGAGKSTLLHILGTLDSADSGTVTIAGSDVNNLAENKLAEIRNKHIGFIFQFHHLLPEFTALENVMIPALINNKSEKEAETLAKKWLDYLGLASRLTHKPGQLSGGEQQRVAVARALINEPRVVMADEPSGNLDTKNAADLHHLFLSLRDDFGQSFIIVTHNNELADMTDRKLEMKDGRIIS